MNISERVKRVFRRTYTRSLLRALCTIDQLSTAQNEELTIVERTRRIKLAADLSLALTSQGTGWSRALIIKCVSQLNRNKGLVKEILGKKRFNDMMKIKRSNAYYYFNGLAGRMKQYLKTNRILSRNIIHRCIHSKNAANMPFKPRASKDPLKNVVNERKLRQLKRVIPGGESINSSSFFLREAADYIVSLKTQVQVMQSLVYNSATLPEPLG